MEDKDLYNFFKTKKHTFNEAPCDALWARIESAMDTPAQQPGKRLSFKNLVLLATALPVSLACIIIFPAEDTIENPETPLLHQNETQYAEPKTTLVDQGKTIAEPKAKSVEVSKGVFSEMQQDTVKKKKPYIAFRKITGPITNTSRDTIPFNVNNVNTVVKNTNGRVTIETKENLTASQFKQLVKKALKENAAAAGTLITVKARGHAVFRQVIKPLTMEPVPKSPTTTPIQKQYVDHVKLMPEKDSLQTELESLSIEPVYLDFKPVGEKLKQ